MKHSPTTSETHLSIVIPTYNEAGSIEALIERIHTAINHHVDSYEVIVIDDHSTDNTTAIAARLASKYPVTIVYKDGARGKSYSLIQGFKQARYTFIAMIDGDLQYPPEALPEMLNILIREKKDIVVGNRVVSDASLLRRSLSVIGRSVYGRLLLGSSMDVQSGLKLFRKSVLEEIELDPTPWTFDMEFLYKATQAGFKIGSCNIRLSKRMYGSSKVNTLKTGSEIVIRTLQLKFEGRDGRVRAKQEPVPDQENIRG